MKLASKKVHFMKKKTVTFDNININKQTKNEKNSENCQNWAFCEKDGCLRNEISQHPLNGFAFCWMYWKGEIPLYKYVVGYFSNF